MNASCWKVLAAVVPLCLSAQSAFGQAFPTKAIRIITTQPGDNSDYNARIVTPGLSTALGQPVIVENRPGTLIAAETAAKAVADGHTLLMLGSSFWLGPLMQKAPYDPIKDFLPVSIITNSPNILVVHPSVPASSVKELIALAKAKPGGLNYSSGAAGGAAHLAAELFKSMAGVDIVRIAYKGGGPALTGVLGGEVQMTFSGAAAVAPHIKSGKLKALAVTTAQPSALAAGLPTIASVLPGYDAGSVQGMWVPARTPRAPIDRLNREVAQILNKSDLRERLATIGAEPAPSSPEQFAAVMKSDIARTAKLIADTGIKAE